MSRKWCNAGSCAAALMLLLVASHVEDANAGSWSVIKEAFKLPGAGGFCRMMSAEAPGVSPPLDAVAKHINQRIDPVATSYYSDAELRNVLGISQAEVDKLRQIESDLSALAGAAAAPAILAGNLESMGEGVPGTRPNIPSAGEGSAATESNAFESDAPITGTIEGLESIADILCFNPGGTLYDSIDAVPKLTDGLKRALDTAKRIPFVQISRPAKILDKALAKPLDYVGDAFESIGSIITDGCDETPKKRPKNWASWWQRQAGKLGKVLKKVVEWPPVRCFSGMMSKYSYAVNFLDLAVTMARKSVTLQVDDLIKQYELAKCILRPEDAAQRGAGVRQMTQFCTPASGRRRLLANETLSITEPPNGSLADVSLTLDMLSVPDAAAGYPFLRASSDGNSQENPQGRKLLQTGTATFASVDSVLSNTRQLLSVMVNIQKAAKEVEKGLQDAGLSRLQSFAREVKDVLDRLAPAVSPLRVVGDIFEGINQAMQFLKCPDFLGFLCQLGDLIGDLVNALVQLVTGRTFDEWIGDLIEKTGLLNVFRDLTSMLPNINEFLDRMNVATLMGEALEQVLDKYFGEIVKLGDFYNPRLYDAKAFMFDGTEQVLRPGVVRKLVGTSGGTPVSFSCAGGSYPIVKTATRTIWRCSQTLSAFMRFPCGGRGAAAGCTVDYNAGWPTDCKLVQYNNGPTPQVLSDLKTMLGVTSLGFEDNFQAEYYCVRNDIDFKVLSELFDGVGDTRAMEVGSWWNTEQKRYSSFPELKVGSTLVRDITCNAGRSIYIEHYQSAGYDGKAWNPCFYRRWVAGEVGWPPGPTEHRQELCYWKTAGLDGRGPGGPMYDTTHPRAWGNAGLYNKYECAGDAAGVYAVLGYYARNTADRLVYYMKNFRDCEAVKSQDQGRDCPVWCGWGACCFWGFPCSHVCGCPCDRLECATQNLEDGEMKNWNFREVTFISPNQLCDQDYGWMNTNGAIQWRGYWDEWYRNSLRNAKAERIRQLSAYANSDYQGECARVVSNCASQTTCSLQGCVPFSLQWSCMEPAFFTSGRTKLVYIFGSSRRALQAGISCPGGGALTVRLAEFGEAIDFRDVTRTVATTMCAAASCNLDISRISGYGGKVLRVEWECACGAGFKPGRADESGACTPCGEGSYRSAGMVDCAPCGPGLYQPKSGQTSCLSCSAGSFSATLGGANCTAPNPGYFSRGAAAVEAIPCPINTYTELAGSSACMACPAGQSTNGAEASTRCSNCTAGAYRSSNMTSCTLCPAGYFSLESASNCTACPAGMYALSPGSTECKSCPVGTYQPSAGSRVCVKCPDNTYTAAVGATAASACSLTTRPVDYDAIAAELAAALLGGNSTLGNSNITAGSAGIGRRLLQSQDMVLCNALLNLFNVSASELGNGFCNHGPWNTVACGFDGGDCCEVTCSQPDMGNSTLQFSCAPLGLACRDPVAIAAAALKYANASPEDCVPPGPTEISPEPNNTMTCPVASNNERLGNGFCEDDLNIKACAYDGGDCCTSTCKPSLLLGSCAPSTLNCRDRSASKDTTAPVVVAPVVFSRPYAGWLMDNRSAEGVEATATDNFPCFVPNITISDKRIAEADCRPGIWYVLNRTYTTTDRAGNVGSATARLNILDDVPPVLVNTPQPNVTVMNSTYVRGGGMANDTKVSATDNSPACFNRAVAYRQDPLLAEPRNCSSQIVYHLLRTWNTTDGANNTAKYQQMVAVRDVEVIKFQMVTLTLPSRGVVTHNLRVPDPLPNKNYTWVVTRTNTVTKSSRQKTGTQVAFTFSAATSVPADFMIPSVRVLDFKVDIHMDYVNCTGPPLKIQQAVMAIRINVV